MGWYCVSRSRLSDSRGGRSACRQMLSDALLSPSVVGKRHSCSFLAPFVGFINVARRSVGRGSGTRVAAESGAVLVLDSGVSQPGMLSEVLTGSVLV